MSRSETYHDTLWLDGIFENYERLQQPFGDMILFVLDMYLPKNFDRSIFGQWKEALSVMRGEGGEGVGQSTVMTITSEEYQEGSLGDLSSIVSRLDKAEIDGFEIQVRGCDEKEEDPKVIIKITKPENSIQGVNEVVAGIEDHTTRVLCCQ